MEVRSFVLLMLIFGQALAADEPPVQLKRVVANGTEFSYVESGKGQPLIFVHGELQDYRAWAKQVQAFAEDYQVIAYSLRNHYPNLIAKDGPGDAAVEIHSADLAAFLNALNLQRVHIVAHSSGAHTALFFAADHPEMVRSLTLSEAPAIGLLRNSPIGLEMRKAMEHGLTPSHDAFRKGDLLDGVQKYADCLMGAGGYERLPEDAQRSMLDNAVAHAADVNARTPPWLFSCDMARNVTAPTLLISGSRSLPVFERINEELKLCLPKSELATISATHAGPMDNARAFNKIVRKFLEKK